MTSREIWIISPYSPVPGQGWGGVKTHTELLATLLAKLGFHVTVIVPRGAASPGGYGSALNVETTESSEPAHTREWHSALLKKAEALVGVCRPDIVISEGYTAEGLEVFLKTRGIPLAAFIHNFHLVHFSKLFSEVDGIRSLLYYLLRTVPRLLFLMTLHEVPFLHSADMVLSVSDRNSGLLRSFYRLRPEKVSTLHNWVQDDFFSAEADLRDATRTDLALPKGYCVFLALGAFWRPKGLQIAISAFRTLARERKDTMFLLAGSGAYERRLKELAGTDFIEAGKIRFLGNWPREKLKGLYAAADIFIIPSIHPEGHAYTLIEAMAAGLPAIATNLGGNPETLGKDGILVPPSDPHALFLAMLSLCDSPEKRISAARLSKERAATLFSEKAAAKTLGTLLAGLSRAFPSAQ